MIADRLKGQPTLIDQLTVDLGGKLVKAVADDMQRARLAREERAKKKKKARGGLGA